MPEQFSSQFLSLQILAGLKMMKKLKKPLPAYELNAAINYQESTMDEIMDFEAT